MPKVCQKYAKSTPPSGGGAAPARPRGAGPGPARGASGLGRGGPAATWWRTFGVLFEYGMAYFWHTFPTEFFVNRKYYKACELYMDVVARVLPGGCQVFAGLLAA